MLLIACGRVGSGPALSITIVALGYGLGSGGSLHPPLSARTSGKRSNSAIKLPSKGEVLSFLHTSASRRATFKSTTGKMATVATRSTGRGCLPSACSTSTGWRSVHFHERSGAEPGTSCDRGRDGNGRQVCRALRAQPSCYWTCDGDRAKVARHLAPQAERGSASGLRGLLCARGRARGPRCGRLLPRRVYWSGVGCGAPQGHRRLHHRVRTGFPCRQPCCGVFVFERSATILDSSRRECSRCRRKSRFSRPAFPPGVDSHESEHSAR
jgi:hypothetical protein